MGNDLYQIGLPVASLSTVLMNWTCFNRPEKLLISPAKKDDWAVVELRNPELAAAIIKDVPEAMVKVVQQPVKVDANMKALSALRQVIQPEKERGTRQKVLSRRIETYCRCHERVCGIQAAGAASHLSA